MTPEKLLCSTCGKTWERPKARGRKPKVCPSCRDNGNKSAPAKDLPKPPEPATVEKSPGSGKTVYCTSKLHIICAEMMGKFPDEYPSCSCKCHKDK